MLKLIAPGGRKGNRTYLARGMVNGTLIERALGVTRKRAAEEKLRALERELDKSPRSGRSLTFQDAAQLYLEFRRPSPFDQACLDRVTGLLGARKVGEIRQSDLVEAANTLYPEGAASTKNRAALRPAASVLHYAAENGHCGWLRVKQFREARPKTRALSPELAQRLIEAAPEGAQRLLLVWLFGQGMRITDALHVRWSDLDLGAGTVSIRVRKTDEDRTFALHPTVGAILDSVPDAERHGYLFPWQNRVFVYRWLNPLCENLGVKFTPHMARHSLATWLAASGASLRVIMEAGGWRSHAAAMRYQSASVEVVREALGKLPKFGSGETGAK